ncbi:MAG: M13-type metalloendopeptidase, partial [Vicinamibacterales bacterium]|nr:M13-type metalloendopeptidase [Vicinamibacterales bacterium]
TAGLAAQSPAPTPLVSGIDPATFDRTVRPLDDLFRHLNGTWLATVAVPADKASYGTFDTLIDKAEADLRVETRDVVKRDNKFAAADLAREFPFFDWNAWLTELGIPPSSPLIVAQPSYAKALGAAVSEWPIERWKPYLAASLIRGFAPYLSKAFVETRFDFYGKTLSGTRALRQQVLTDPHPPEEFRANGAVGNMPEFYAVFGAKPGDKLYIAPELRVKIW